MPEGKSAGILRILTDRAGTVTEITQFLIDLEAAYLALYQLDRRWTRQWSRPDLFFMIERGLPFPLFGGQGGSVLTSDTLLPEDILIVKSVRIESPGFWEIAASFNPLQQIREYLNDRHRRRQDHDFREAAERDRLQLENELIQRQIWEKENSVLSERIRILKEIGLPDHEIRQLVWAQVGKPLAQLGRHQDSRLIGGAE